MKTLEQIKNDYSKSIGYGDWENLDYNVNDSKDFDKHWKNVCIIAQKECLRLANREDLVNNENNIIK